MTKNTLHIYTDGACQPNPGFGGWAAIMIYNNHIKELSGFARNPKTTNNEMELLAILKALLAIKKSVPTIIYSDSQYAINCLTVWHKSWSESKWKKAKNAELIQKIIPLISNNVTFKWVRGHTGNKHNERADFLAQRCAKERSTWTHVNLGHRDTEDCIHDY